VCEEKSGEWKVWSVFMVNNILSLNSTFRQATLAGILFLQAGGVIVIVGDVESSMIAKIIWAGIYACTCLLVLMSSSSVFLQVKRNPGFILLALLCVVSTIWSSDRSTTVHHSIAIFGGTVLGYLIITKFKPIEFLRLIAIALFFLLAINVIMMIPNLLGCLGPSIRYSGVFPHPNMLGRISGLAVLIFLLLSFTRIIPYVLGGIGIGMGFLLLIACDSMTSIVSLCVAFGIFLIRRMVARPVGGGSVAVTIWLIVCFGGLVWLNWSIIIDFLFGLLGRSPTLTGRTELWEGLLGAVLRKPLLGYGYSAFWGGESYLTGRIFANAGWHTQSAHNGLLGIALNLGLLGVVLFISTVGRSFIYGIKLAFMGINLISLSLLSILTYLLLLGVSESTYMVRNSIYWLLFLICSIYLNQIMDTKPIRTSSVMWEENENPDPSFIKD